jgi:hypothetical protein
MDEILNSEKIVKSIYFYKLYKPHKNYDDLECKRDIKWIYYRDRHKNNKLKEIIDEFNNNNKVYKAKIICKNDAKPYIFYK